MSLLPFDRSDDTLGIMAFDDGPYMFDGGDGTAPNYMPPATPYTVTDEPLAVPPSPTPIVPDVMFNNSDWFSVSIPASPIECYWGSPYQDSNGEWKCPSDPIPQRTPPSPKPVNPPFACFWGTPYQDVDGVWHCPSDPTNPTGSPVATDVPATPQTDQQTNPDALFNQSPVAGSPIQTIAATSTSTTATQESATSSDTLFGFPKTYVYIGGAVAAFLLLSSMEGKK